MATILIVDDAAIMLEVCSRYLRAAGHEVVAVESGAAAIAALHGRLPDLIVLDYMMPEMDGHALLAWIRANERTRAIPTLFLTAADDEPEVLTRALELGATAYLLKPVDKTSFVRSVTALLSAPLGTT